MIDFDLNTERGTGSPDASAGVPEQKFSVRWTGVVQLLMDGAYTFYVDGDNDVRLYIDGKRIIKKTSKGREEESKKVRLHGGRAVEVKVEYVHANGAPSLHVLWSGPQMEKQVLMPVKP